MNSNTGKISEYFSIAAEAAKTSNVCQKHGSVVVRNHRIISEANNVVSYHAELHALKRCKKVKRCFL